VSVRSPCGQVPWPRSQRYGCDVDHHRDPTERGSNSVRTCPVCLGTDIDCSTCAGHGVLLSLLIPCPHCNGLGELEGGRCRVCYGTGEFVDWITVEQPSRVFTAQELRHAYDQLHEHPYEEQYIHGVLCVLHQTALERY